MYINQLYQRCKAPEVYMSVDAKSGTNFAGVPFFVEYKLTLRKKWNGILLPLHKTWPLKAHPLGPK